MNHIAVVLLFLTLPLSARAETKNNTQKENWREPTIFSAHFAARLKKKFKKDNSIDNVLKETISIHTPTHKKKIKELASLKARVRQIQHDIDKNAEAARESLRNKLTPKQQKTLDQMLKPGPMAELLEAIESTPPQKKTAPDVMGIDMNED